MIIENLYEEALVKPVINGCKELYVVSGYASATFAYRHLSQLEDFKLNLIIGMPGKRSDHLGYLALYEKFKNRFKGHYLNSSPPVHSKLYAWHKEGAPFVGYSGSANYSQPGFTGNKQVNQLISDNPLEISDFYKKLIPRTTEIISFEYEPLDFSNHRSPSVDGSVQPGELIWDIPDKRVTISFLDIYGALPAKSGLNWGQRERREPNQAYLSLKKDSRKEGFLPTRGDTFTLIADDSFVMDCVIAQGGRKGIQSTNSNSELGLYIRKRLGLKSGEFVTVEHLEKYGRTDFTIEKRNNETFYLDFSVIN